MAYGQTGTGKTFTIGQLGERDASDRGIMVRSMEDILADLSPDTDTVTVSYLQVVFFNVHYCFLNQYPISIDFYLLLSVLVVHYFV